MSRHFFFGRKILWFWIFCRKNSPEPNFLVKNTTFNAWDHWRAQKQLFIEIMHFECKNIGVKMECYRVCDAYSHKFKRTNIVLFTNLAGKTRNSRINALQTKPYGDLYARNGCSVYDMLLLKGFGGWIQQGKLTAVFLIVSANVSKHKCISHVSCSIGQRTIHIGSIIQCGCWCNKRLWKFNRIADFKHDLARNANIVSLTINN